MTHTPRSYRVLIIQAQIKQYRVPFFLELREVLKSSNIQLRVAYSPPPASERAKNDNVDLPESMSTLVPGWWMLRGRVLYQPLLREIAAADLVVVEHASKFLLNHLLLLLGTLHVKHFGFWGLGLNKQSDRSQLSEWFKKLTVRQANWYFAYTRGVAEEVASYGFPSSRITSVQNAVDTLALQNQISSISKVELCEERMRLGMPSDAPVGLYCGMLDSVKGVPFLIESAKAVRRQVQNFHLVLVGGGPHQDEVRQLSKDLPWIHLLGPRFEYDKALVFGLADIFLLPGRVGLVILDCFAAHLPLLTVKLSIHGPEIEYLEDGVNGFMVERTVTAFADKVVSTLRDRELLSRLQKNAARSAARYNVEAMAQNFSDGIRSCLGVNPPSSPLEFAGMLPSHLDSDHQG